jgi:hypothetical protein
MDTWLIAQKDCSTLKIFFGFVFNSVALNGDVNVQSFDERKQMQYGLRL